jgi:hypothetical protein
MSKVSEAQMSALMKVMGEMIGASQTEYTVPLLPDCQAKIKFTRPPDQQAIHRLAVILIGMKESFPETGPVKTLEQIVADAIAAAPQKQGA